MKENSQSRRRPEVALLQTFRGATGAQLVAQFRGASHQVIPEFQTEFLASKLDDLAEYYRLYFKKFVDGWSVDVATETGKAIGTELRLCSLRIELS